MRFFSILFGALLLAGCSSELTPEEKLIGTWQIYNVNELQKDFVAENLTIKNSQMTFQDDGTLISRIEKAEEIAKWELTEDKSKIIIKADSIGFNEQLPFAFENERTIVIRNQGRRLVFKKM